MIHVEHGHIFIKKCIIKKNNRMFVFYLSVVYYLQFIFNFHVYIHQKILNLNNFTKISDFYDKIETSH